MEKLHSFCSIGHHICCPCSILSNKSCTLDDSNWRNFFIDFWVLSNAFYNWKYHHSCHIFVGCNWFGHCLWIYSLQRRKNEINFHLCSSYSSFNSNLKRELINFTLCAFIHWIFIYSSGFGRI